jgi:AraC-like DNA-binding protein
MKDFSPMRAPSQGRGLARPVTIRFFPYRNGQHEPRHRHDYSHLIVALRGVVRVSTPSRTWTLPPSRGLWLPSNIDHQLDAIGDLDLCTVSIRPDAAAWLWGMSRIIAVSPLLRELLLSLTADEKEYAADSKTAISVSLLLKIMEEAPSLGEGGLPLPRNSKLLSICERMVHSPATDYTVDRWADEIGTSSRTLARHFKNETGMSFGHWCQQMKAAEATTRLALGASVAQVAHDLGYSTPSAFAVMFRRLFGASPHQYLSSLSA